MCAVRETASLRRNSSDTLSFPESYDLIHTFECGQTFRFVSFDDGNTYYGPYGDRILKIRQVDAQTLEIDSNITKGLESITEHFFRPRR